MNELTVLDKMIENKKRELAQKAKILRDEKENILNPVYENFCREIDEFVESDSEKEYLCGWTYHFYSGYDYTDEQKEYAKSKGVAISSTYGTDGTVYIFEKVRGDNMNDLLIEKDLLNSLTEKDKIVLRIKCVVNRDVTEYFDVNAILDLKTKDISVTEDYEFCLTKSILNGYSEAQVFTQYGIKKSAVEFIPLTQEKDCGFIENDCRWIFRSYPPKKLTIENIKGDDLIRIDDFDVYQVFQEPSGELSFSEDLWVHQRLLDITHLYRKIDEDYICIWKKDGVK